MDAPAGLSHVQLIASGVFHSIALAGAARNVRTT